MVTSGPHEGKTTQAFKRSAATCPAPQVCFNLSAVSVVSGFKRPPHLRLSRKEAKAALSRRLMRSSFKRRARLLRPSRLSGDGSEAAQRYKTPRLLKAAQLTWLGDRRTRRTEEEVRGQRKRSEEEQRFQGPLGLMQHRMWIYRSFLCASLVCGLALDSNTIRSSKEAAPQSAEQQTCSNRAQRRHSDTDPHLDRQQVKDRTTDSFNRTRAAEMWSCVRSADCAAGLCCVRYLTGRRCQRIPQDGEACELRGAAKRRRNLGRCACANGLVCAAAGGADRDRGRGRDQDRGWDQDQDQDRGRGRDQDRGRDQVQDQDRGRASGKRQGVCVLRSGPAQRDTRHSSRKKKRTAERSC